MKVNSEMGDAFTDVVGQALLRNGRSVTLARVTAGDLTRIRSFYEQLSDTATYFRFLGTRRRLPDSELQRLVTEDVRSHLALLASIDDELIGIGEYVVGSIVDEAEVAFCVADDHHREGVATLLLERLAVVAQRIGIKRFVASTLFGNQDMLLVFRTVGLAEQTHLDKDVVNVTLDLTSLTGLEARSAERHQLAVAAAL